MTQEDILLAALPFAFAWIWWVDKKVAAHEAVIVKMDQLIDMLLEAQIAQNQDRRKAEESDYRRSYR